MAALGKIRQHGRILVIIISLGLFAFIAEELFRSLESSRNDKRQQVGSVMGENINVQDFQKLVDEYTEVIKMQQGTANLNDEQLNQVKDMVWNTYIQSKIVEKEAEKLGLTVTDAEIQNILQEGTNPLLLQTPFVNQQTRRFDVNALKQFLAQYKTQQNTNPQTAEQYTTIYKYWTFIEKTLRQQTLAEKYQGLLAHCILSNPIEAKMAFKDANEESQIQLASFPYSSIDDSKVKPTEEELKAKYDELKPRFKQAVESRDIKYVDVEVSASATDRAALNKDFASYKAQFSSNTDPAEIVRKSTSSIPYIGIPVDKTAYPADIAQRIDSMHVGQIYGPIENKQDNTMNLIKLVAKQNLPDSVQYRMIQVGAQTPEQAHTKADSIMKALQGGANFEAIAKKYNQTGEKTWMTTAQYQTAQTMDKDTKAYIEALNTLGVNETKNIEITQGNIILQVIDRKAMTDKYIAAVVKRSIDFSKDTYRAAYNKFSSFVSANETAATILKNAAKFGYKVQELKDVTTSGHYLAGIHSTRDAMKWLFDAEEGDVSPMYECGDNNHLLIVVLDKIHKKGYRQLSDPQVLEIIKAEVIRDKKADILINKAKGIKSIAAAKAKGALIGSVNQVTFAAPAFIQTTGASEPALSGAVSATKKGTFVKAPVKGLAGVYLFQVANKKMRPGKFNDEVVEQQLRQQYMQYASQFMNELYIKAHVVDNRYLFF